RAAGGEGVAVADQVRPRGIAGLLVEGVGDRVELGLTLEAAVLRRLGLGLRERRQIGRERTAADVVETVEDESLGRRLARPADDLEVLEPERGLVANAEDRVLGDRGLRLVDLQVHLRR